MSDLFETLHTLVVEDLDLPPVPAAEIRRRGDRMRRRRIALQALAGTTVVAMVVWGIGLLVGDARALSAPAPSERTIEHVLIGGWSHGRG